MLIGYRANSVNNKNQYAINSKKRLINNITKKFKTTMIGALNYVEIGFGHLWGMNKSGPLTEQERANLDVWQQIRTEILNNGNNQLRACLDELAQYTMTWDKYQTKFILNTQDKEDFNV